MTNLKLLTIILLPMLWSFYFIFELITGRVTNLPILIGNFALLILFSLCGYIIYYLNSKLYNGFSTKNIFILFSALMLIDQGIKIIIHFFFFDNNFVLIKDLLSFNPIINTDGSWINARFGAGFSFSFLILINIIALFLFLEFYRYILSKSKKSSVL